MAGIGVKSRKLYAKAECATKDTVVIEGSFETDTTEATNVRGEGFKVERTAASVYQITFANLYPQMTSIVFTIENSSDALLNRTISATPYASATGTVKLYILDPATGAAPVGEDNGPRVNFRACCKKRTTEAVDHTTLVEG